MRIHLNAHSAGVVDRYSKEKGITVTAATQELLKLVDIIRNNRGNREESARESNDNGDKV